MFIILAWRNLWRNRNRTLITMASVWCAVLLAVVLSSLQKGIMDQMVSNVVGFYSGYVQVHQKGYWADRSLENSFILTDSSLQAVQRTVGVRSVAPRVETFALVSSGDITKGCMVTGISPAREDEVTRLSTKLTAGQYLTDSAQTLLLAEGLANRFKAGVGDTLILLGQGRYGGTAAGKFAIRGILHFGSPDLNDRLVYLSLAAAQNWLDAPGLATELVVSPQNPQEADDAAARVRASLPATFEVMTWKEMMPEINELIRTKFAGNAIIQGILYMLISFGIFATLLMMMAERKREFGMLVALGMKKYRLALVVLLESIFVTVTGCLAGLLTCIPVVWRMATHPIRITGEMAKTYEKFGLEPIFPAATDAYIFWKQVVIVLFIGLLLSIYPVVRVILLKPVEALRS